MAVDPYAQMGNPWLPILAIVTLLAAESFALWLWLSARDELNYRLLADANAQSLASGGGGRLKHGRISSGGARGTPAKRDDGTTDAQGPPASSGRGPALPNYWPTPRRSHPLLRHARRNLRSTAKEHWGLPTPSKLPPPHGGEAPDAALVRPPEAGSCGQLDASPFSSALERQFSTPANGSPGNSTAAHDFTAHVSISNAAAAHDTTALFAATSSSKPNESPPNYASARGSWRVSKARCTPSPVTSPAQLISASPPQHAASAPQLVASPPRPANLAKASSPVTPPTPEHGSDGGPSRANTPGGAVVGGAVVGGAVVGGHVAGELSRAWLRFGAVLRSTLKVLMRILMRTPTTGVEYICCAFVVLVVLVIPIEIQIFGPLLMAHRPLLSSQPPQLPPPSSPPAPPSQPDSDCALLEPFGGGELHVLVVGLALIVGAGLTIAVHHIVASCRGLGGSAANTRRWIIRRGRLADAVSDRSSSSLLDA